MLKKINSHASWRLAQALAQNVLSPRQKSFSGRFGVGSLDAEIMYVGEAPGLDEDRQGEPFVGKAGQLLTKIIQTMGLSREKVYIANVLKCRPDTPGQTYGNRKPTPLEMQTCWPYLLEQIKCIRPKVIVALGTTAGRSVRKKQWGSHTAWESSTTSGVSPSCRPTIPPMCCGIQLIESSGKYGKTCFL